ncbi:ABC transporter ATP-binding protein [Ornithinimicrobium sp. W1679]|uniref:ABC transporter ATP-binding protein n=1 Tax=Ornithinimicrobium sp. W1679 TaxID=3418770 RepID=UPI003CEA2D36
MRDVLHFARLILDRRTKAVLVLASLGLVFIAGMDMLAISLVYPLVTAATGETPDLGPLGDLVPALDVTDSQRLVVILASLVVALFVLKSLTSVAFSWWLNGFTNRHRAELSTRILDSYLHRPYGEISRRSTSELLRTQQEGVNQFFLSGIGSLMMGLSHLTTVLGISLVLFFAAPLATAVLVLYFTVTGLIYSRLVRPAARRSGRAVMATAARSWKTAFTALGAVKEVQLRGSQTVFVDEYGQAAQEAAQAHRVANFVSGLSRPILEIMFIIAIGLALVLTSTGTTSASGGQTVGLLSAFVAAGFRILPALNGLLSSVTAMQTAQEGARLVGAELARGTTSAEQGNRLVVTPPHPVFLRLADVGFRYPGATEDVLADVSLELASGTTVAIVGSSGAGKTTLIDLILGFHHPSTGAIEAGGVDIHADLQTWRDRVAYVPQDVYILEATLEENIVFDRRILDPVEHEATLARVVEQAELTDLLQTLPEGVRTLLGERGSRLSGGQKQRVGLARALYRGPELLVLDEATSALDNITEKRITDVIRRMRGSVTTLIVAHRLSTVKEADVIVLLDKGQVAAQGTFDELQHNSAHFAELVRLGSLT